MSQNKRVLLFGGTREGRELAALFLQNSYELFYSCVTEYGRELLECDADIEGSYSHKLHHLVGIKKRDEIVRLLQDLDIKLVVDATHPYASSISLSLAHCCLSEKVALVRFNRVLGSLENLRHPNIHRVHDHFEAVAYYKEHFSTETIFLSTGAHKLEAYAQDGLKDKVVLRILPNERSRELALAAGFLENQLICAQAPFSQELNKQHFSQYDARVLITKDGGAAAGFNEKISAALELGMDIILIAPPQNSEEQVAIQEELGQQYAQCNSYQELLQQVDIWMN